MKNRQIYDFFYDMPMDEFERKFDNLSKTDEFSAVASRADYEQDVDEVKRQLIAIGVCAEWLEEDFRSVIRCITSRFMSKLN